VALSHWKKDRPNDDRNRTVCSSRRKTGREGAFRTCCSGAFHVCAAATGNLGMTDHRESNDEWWSSQMSGVAYILKNRALRILYFPSKFPFIFHALICFVFPFYANFLKGLYLLSVINSILLLNSKFIVIVTVHYTVHFFKNVLSQHNSVCRFFGVRNCVESAFCVQSSTTNPNIDMEK